jgi:hypothetical protein
VLGKKSLFMFTTNVIGGNFVNYLNVIFSAPVIDSLQWLIPLKIKIILFGITYEDILEGKGFLYIVSPYFNFHPRFLA